MMTWTLRGRWAVALLAVCITVATMMTRAQRPVDDMNAVRAPELEPNLGWLNTDAPLRFDKDLKGQVVLLDFWTYCCINCIHILPDLEFLEEKYKDQPFAVIGVHSAKFENEANRETIRAAIQRYKIKHPVVIDDDMGIWNRYTARGWPTFVLIDSRGRVVGMTSGEGNRDKLDGAIAKALEQGRTEGTLAAAPLKFNPEGSFAPTGVLAFPGKVMADPAANRLFIADSNHNRIVVTTLPAADGQTSLVTVIGNGTEGAADGSFAQATFDNPQGMAILGNRLFIADTDNHLIREANLDNGTVTTVAGTGAQSYDRAGGKRGTAQGLASPWALELVGSDRLIIAMAGTHQIWEMNLSTGIVKMFAGNGQENIVDGPPARANFAQPSGLALLDGFIYVADSEVSGIRKVDAMNGNTETIIGSGLFVFGDQDGTGDAVRLQHALGVTTWQNKLVIADTYNHKIKRIDPATRETTTLLGTGRPGTRTEDGKPAFFEPGGLDARGDIVYVADTNNHRIVMANLASGEWSEVMISGLSAPGAAAGAGLGGASTGEPAPPWNFRGDQTTLTLELTAQLPGDAHPTEEAPMQVRVQVGDTVIAQQTYKTDTLPVALDIPAAAMPDSGSLTVRWSFAWCEKGNASVCIPERLVWTLPVDKAGPGSVGAPVYRLNGTVKPAG